MTEHQEFEKLVRELEKEFGEPNEDDLKIVKKFWDGGIQYERKRAKENGEPEKQ